MPLCWSSSRTSAGPTCTPSCRRFSIDAQYRLLDRRRPGKRRAHATAGDLQRARHPHDLPQDNQDKLHTLTALIKHHDPRDRAPLSDLLTQRWIAWRPLDADRPHMLQRHITAKTALSQPDPLLPDRHSALRTNTTSGGCLSPGVSQRALVRP